jgi:hypothetical protein
MGPTVTTPRPTMGRPINMMIEIDPPLRPTNILCSITTTVTRHNQRRPPKGAQCISIFDVSVRAIGFHCFLVFGFQLNQWIPSFSLTKSYGEEFDGLNLAFVSVISLHILRLFGACIYY